MTAQTQNNARFSPSDLFTSVLLAFGLSFEVLMGIIDHLELDIEELNNSLWMDLGPNQAPNEFTITEGEGGRKLFTLIARPDGGVDVIDFTNEAGPLEYAVAHGLRAAQVVLGYFKDHMTKATPELDALPDEDEILGRLHKALDEKSMPAPVLALMQLIQDTMKGTVVAPDHAKGEQLVTWISMTLGLEREETEWACTRVLAGLLMAGELVALKKDADRHADEVPQFVRDWLATI